MVTRFSINGLDPSMPRGAGAVARFLCVDLDPSMAMLGRDRCSSDELPSRRVASGTRGRLGDRWRRSWLCGGGVSVGDRRSAAVVGERRTLRETVAFDDGEPTCTVGRRASDMLCGRFRGRAHTNPQALDRLSIDELYSVSCTGTKTGTKACVSHTSITTVTLGMLCDIVILQL